MYDFFEVEMVAMMKPARADTHSVTSKFSILYTFIVGA